MSLTDTEARIMSRSHFVDRDDLNPDTIIEHYGMAVRSLEIAVESVGLAADWETLKVQTHLPRECAPSAVPQDLAVITADVAILS